jgi:hypothetical protein
MGPGTFAPFYTLSQHEKSFTLRLGAQRFLALLRPLSIHENLSSILLSFMSKFLVKFE